MKKLLKDLLNASIWFVFTTIALHSIFYAIKFFLLKNEEIMDGNLFDCQSVSIFCLVFGLIILLGIPAIMTIALQETKLIWRIIMVASSLSSSIFGSFFALFAISELLNLSINLNQAKILTIMSIAFNLLIVINTKKKNKERKKNLYEGQHSFIAKDKT